MNNISNSIRILPFQYVLKDNLLQYRDFIVQNTSKPTTFKKNTVITENGMTSEGAYFLMKGMIKISTLNVNGYERILGYHKENTLFAMDGLHSEESVIVTTTAITDTSAIYIPTKKLTELFRKNPEFATDTIIYYSDVLKFMCYDAEYQFGNSVLTKLANFISMCLQCDEFKSAEYLPFSQYELASAIGASRIQVARVCAELKQQGCIDIKKKRLYIKQADYFFGLTSYYSD